MITSPVDRVSAMICSLRRAGLRTTLAHRGVVDALGEAVGERRHLHATEVHQRLTGPSNGGGAVHRAPRTHPPGGRRRGPHGAGGWVGDVRVCADLPHHHAVCQGCGRMRQLTASAAAGTVSRQRERARAPAGAALRHHSWPSARASRSPLPGCRRRGPERRDSGYFPAEVQISCRAGVRGDESVSVLGSHGFPAQVFGSSGPARSSSRCPRGSRPGRPVSPA